MVGGPIGRRFGHSLRCPFQNLCRLLRLLKVRSDKSTPAPRYSQQPAAGDSVNTPLQHCRMIQLTTQPRRPNLAANIRSFAKLLTGCHKSRIGKSNSRLLNRPSHRDSVEVLCLGFADRGRILFERRAQFGLGDSADRPHTTCKLDSRLSAPLSVFQFEGLLMLGPVICLGPSICVAADRGCNHFRDRHRPEWRCYSWSPSHDRQPKHWIETKLLY